MSNRAAPRPTRAAMYARVLVAALGLGGCIDGIAWTDEARLRPELSAAHTENTLVDNTAYWQAEVAAAMAAWNAPIVATGCPAPFTLAPDDPAAYPVRLIPWNQWPHPDDKVGMQRSGDRSEGFIDVREWRPRHDNLPTLVHELGHALGLEHTDDPTSVMTPDVSSLREPSRQDVMRAACR